MRTFLLLLLVCTLNFYAGCFGLQPSKYAVSVRNPIRNSIAQQSNPLRHSSRLTSSPDSATNNAEKKVPPKRKWILGTLEETLNGLLYGNLDKESNRKFRRTVFTKHNWQRHRSSNRYFTELRNMPKSVILRGLGVQTLVVTLFSLLIVSYNTLVEMKKFPFPMPLLSFPALPFALTSSSLGLLLVFRTNAAYSRWKDARVSWALISSRAFDLMRQGMIFITNPSCKSRLVRYTVAFAKVTKWHLGHQGNDKRLRGDLDMILTTQEVDRMLLSRNRVQWTMMRISEVMKESELVPNVHCHIDKGLMEMTSAFYTCDRIFTTPIPLMYTRHTARFLLIWLLTVPMSLYHEFRKTQTLAVPFIIPLISFFNAIFLFGIEELGVQIEEPFSILPLANICNDIQYAGEDLLKEGGVSWFGHSEKQLEKNVMNVIEKEKKIDVEKAEKAFSVVPLAKDVFVYSKKGEAGSNYESAALKTSLSNSLYPITMDLPSDIDVELSIARKDLGVAVSRNISSASKRELIVGGSDSDRGEGKGDKGEGKGDKGEGREDSREGREKSDRSERSKEKDKVTTIENSIEGIQMGNKESSKDISREKVIDTLSAIQNAVQNVGQPVEDAVTHAVIP